MLKRFEVRLIAAADAVLRREGRTLSTYGLNSGPQGYRALREFLVAKLKADADIACSADDILITSGSLQAIDLVNATLLVRGDTVVDRLYDDARILSGCLYLPRQLDRIGRIRAHTDPRDTPHRR